MIEKKDYPSDDAIAEGLMAEINGLNKKRRCCIEPSKVVSFARDLAKACEAVRRSYPEVV